MNYSTPSKQGINPGSIISFIDEIERENIELHGLVIIKNGQVVTEGYWKPYSADRVHQLCSVTKTFTCMAVGFAIDEGKLALDDTLYKFFPEKFPADADERTKRITVHDLLCMGSGMEKELGISDASDAVKAFLASNQLHEPGTHFKYNSLGSHMLSEIIYKVTGQQLSGYLQPRLFEPLGIKCVKWLKTPQGAEFGGAGLHLTTMDIAKAGQLLLQKGMWEGKQILPRWWAETAVEKKIYSVAEGDDWIDWAEGYCYQMWCGMQDGSYRLDGAFGQYALVFPSENMVIGLTAANTKRPLTMRIIEKHLFNTVDKEDAEGDKLLEERLESLSIGKDPVTVRRSETEKSVNCKTYIINENSMSFVPLSERWFICETNCNIRFIQLEFYKEHCKLTWREGNVTNTAMVGLDGKYRESVHRASYWDRALISVGHWEDDGTFVMSMRSIEDASTLFLRFEFDGDKVEISMSETITDFNPKYEKLVGKSEDKLAYSDSGITFDN